MARTVKVDEKIILGWLADLGELGTAVETIRTRVSAALEELDETRQEYALLHAKTELMRQQVVDALDGAQEE